MLLADWQCVPATSYVYPGTSVPARRATGPGDSSSRSISTRAARTRATRRCGASGRIRRRVQDELRHRVDPTNRTHCIAWSGWADDAIVEREQGVRLDTNYYYWPGSWMLGFPGMFTGSGFPMRFATPTDRSSTSTRPRRNSPTSGARRSRRRSASRSTSRAARSRRRSRGVLRRLHRQHAHRRVQRAPPGRGRDRRRAQARGVPVVSAEQMLDCSTPQRSSFRDVGFSGGTCASARARPARRLAGHVPARAPCATALRARTPSPHHAHRQGIATSSSRLPTSAGARPRAR